MKRRIPWKLLRFIDRHTRLCWSSLVCWNLGYTKTSEMERMGRCFKLGDGEPYCGKCKKEGL